MMRTPLLNNQNSDERFQDILNRYLEMERAGNSRYFDLDELEELIDFYIHISDYEEANKIINYGLSIHHLENILLIKKAKLLVYSNAYDQALSILNSLTCNDAEILCIKGEALTVQGNPKEAVLYFEAFINMHPINERAILSHDIALFLNNHEAHNHAIYIIEKALEHSPKQIDLLQEYAYSLEQNGETERYIAIFNQLLNIDPYKTGTLFLLGS